MHELFNEKREEELLTSIEEAVKRIPNSTTLRVLLGILDSYSQLARGELILDPENSLKSKFYYDKVGQVAFLRWRIFRGDYPQFTLNDPNLAGQLIVDPLFMLLSDNMQLFHRQIEEVHKLKGDSTPSASRKVALAFQAFVKGEKMKAKELLNDAHKKADRWARGYDYAVAGLIYEDEALINEALGHAKKLYVKGGYDKWTFAGYDEQSTAIAKLASLYGYEVDVSDPIINKAMLKTEVVPYEPITDIYQALGIEPIKF
ncbi:hypothetical protein LAG90_12265 [Marinilongibacter aquaticus]|uniref:hypothetical protein n=1 Tax=Marinilongibacter aquaticus TaxID=2975157 RepID=UPI0021BD3D17|nr:hypothetical protein [Marinilongibacter aquaticus]UBM57590.1 hypothetical protein LAG90_12265 [Marinilongibacter aquaticus]